MKVKGVDLSALNKRQQTAMKRHGASYSEAHERYTEAYEERRHLQPHKASMRAVGK